MNLNKEKMTKQNFNQNDISTAWQKLADKKFFNPEINKSDIMKAIKMDSQSSIAELKKRLKYKLFWAAGFIIAFGTALLFSLGNNDMAVLLGIGTTAYIIGFIPMFIKYKQIDDDINGSKNILKSIKDNVKLIKSVLKLESIWGMIIFTPAILMGILGGRVLTGWSLLECIQDSKTLIISLILILVFTPLLHWGASKMNEIAFGAYLRKLEESIMKMEALT